MTASDGITQPKFWAAFKRIARKLIPSRSLRWCLLYVPGFCAALLFALKVFGEPIPGGGSSFDDLASYVFEAGSRSVPVMIAIAITYALATGLDWNLDNTYRRKLQEQLRQGMADADRLTSWQRGAFLILAGETFAILALLVVILAAMLVFQ